MRIGIDIDNVISNIDEVLKQVFIKHDKEFRNTGVVNPDLYITKGMLDWSRIELDDFCSKNDELILTTA